MHRYIHSLQRPVSFPVIGRTSRGEGMSGRQRRNGVGKGTTMRYPTIEHHGASEGVMAPAINYIYTRPAACLSIAACSRAGKLRPVVGRAQGSWPSNSRCKHSRRWSSPTSISTTPGEFPICWPGLGVASRGEGLLQTTAKGNLKSDGINCKHNKIGLPYLC